VNDIVASLVASWACLSGACLFLYKLMLLEGDHKTAARAVKFLLIFPSTVFLGAPYTESMFLLFSFGCIYFARVRKFIYAGIMGGLAALTRCTGVLLIVLIFVEILIAHELTPKSLRQNLKQKLRNSLKDFASLLIVAVCALSYLYLNHVMLQGDDLAFMQYQSDHWSQGFGSYSNTLMTTYNQMVGGVEIRTKLLLWVKQFIVLIIGGLSLPLISKRMRPSYGAYSIAYVFVAFAPTWLLSGLRYYMGLAVLFPALALVTRRKWLDVALTIVFAILAVAFSCFFAVHWDIL
jgi:Gpi18-like mannosyltransferase